MPRKSRLDIGKTKKELVKLKSDLRKISALQRKSGKNKKPISFLEAMRKYAALERRAHKITRRILKNGR